MSIAPLPERQAPSANILVFEFREKSMCWNNASLSPLLCDQRGIPLRKGSRPEQMSEPPKSCLVDLTWAREVLQCCRLPRDTAEPPAARTSAPLLSLSPLLATRQQSMNPPPRRDFTMGHRDNDLLTREIGRWAVQRGHLGTDRSGAVHCGGLVTAMWAGDKRERSSLRRPGSYAREVRRCRSERISRWNVMRRTLRKIPTFSRWGITGRQGSTEARESRLQLLWKMGRAVDGSHCNLGTIARSKDYWLARRLQRIEHVFGGSIEQRCLEGMDFHPGPPARGPSPRLLDPNSNLPPFHDPAWAHRSHDPPSSTFRFVEDSSFAIRRVS